MSILMRCCLGFLVIVLLQDCGPKGGRLTAPTASYEERFVEQTSVINVPININLRDLERNVNRQLEGVIYQDNSFDDGDNMTLTARKVNDIRLTLENMAIAYRVPLSIGLRYDLGLGKVNASGDIALDFRTEFSIQPNWSLQTKTTLVKYDWLSAPRVQLAGISIPVGTIANYIIRRGETAIANDIDALVRENLRLETHVQQAWLALFQPVELSEEYQTWLQVYPERISMTPMRVENGAIRSSLVINSKPRLAFGAKPAAPSFRPLPPFTYATPGPDDFSVYVGATISYTEAERLAKQSVQGERFEQGRRYVVVDDIQLYGQGNQLIVNLALSGSYRGNIYLSGRPQFNPETNRIDLKDLEYTLDTRNFLVRSAGWLLKSTLKRKIQENMDFLLTYNLEDVQKQVQEQLTGYQIASGITLEGELQQIDLYNAYLTTDGIEVAVALKGRVAVEVAGLMDFGDK